MRPHNIIPGALLVYCFCDFHPSCSLIYFLEIGGVGYVACDKCKVLMHVDLAGHRVSIEDGKESVNV